MLSSTTDRASTDPGALALGLLVIAIGLFVVAVAADVIRLDPRSIRVPRWVLACVGFVFVAGGLAVIVPGHTPRNFLGAVIFTLFAVSSGWIAFGPGSRRFGGGLGIGPFTIWASQAGALAGRIAFGFGAIVLGGLAIYAWGYAVQDIVRRRRSAHGSDEPA